MLQHALRRSWDRWEGEGGDALDLDHYEHTGTMSEALSRHAEEAYAELDAGDKVIAERLFKPFDTTKGNAGMGIGVYESREVVAAAGGRMEVTSEPGHGTTFRISLPVEPGAGDLFESVSATGR